MSNKTFLSSMKADELRMLHNGQTRINLPATHNYKYMKYLDQKYPTSHNTIAINNVINPGSNQNDNIKNEQYEYLVDNLGQLHNDDSIAQLTHSIPNTAITVPMEPIVRWVIINSADRDWYNRIDENPYSYGAHLGQSSQYQDTTTGILKNIELTINKHFENIIKLECTSVIIPSRILSNKSSPTFNQHLLIGLGTSTSALYGSNNATNTALTILVPKLPTSIDNATIRHIEYTTTAQMGKDYLTPDASLNRLYINITRPDGYNLWLDNIANDIITIQVIYMADSTDKYLDIIILGYMNPSDFTGGDIIKFKEYQFHGTQISGYKEAAQFNQFINREAGHIIQSVDQFTNITIPAYSGVMNNVIRILAPGTNSSATGLWVFSDWFSDSINMGFIQKFPDFIELPTATSTKDNTGKGLNTSTQTVSVLKITCLDKNAGQLVKKLI